MDRREAINKLKKFKKLNFFRSGAKMYDYWNLRMHVDFLCYSPQEFNMSKIYHQSVTDGRKSNVVAQDGIFSSMLKNHRL